VTYWTIFVVHVSGQLLLPSTGSGFPERETYILEGLGVRGVKGSVELVGDQALPVC
jgi:hypothetical protein